ncbi:MAG: tetratricopeptide repeat protein [Cyanobacteria bacterium J06598_3]
MHLFSQPDSARPKATLQDLVRSLTVMVLGILLSLGLTLVDTASAIAGSVNAGQATLGLLPQLSNQEVQTISKLRKAAFEATSAGQFDLAELQWTALIEQLPDEAAVWSNRGNVRVRRNNLDGAMLDYTQAIAIAPNEPDPYLNRGAVLEAMGEWQQAIDDYNQVLQLTPDDPAAYNNRGNAEAGLNEWELAIADYQAAITLQPSFSLGYGNYALALYQTGETDKALQIMKSLVRKYPSFADMRAALTAVLWVQGQGGEAESNWVAVVGLDSRYKDLNWVKNVRRWPPKMVTALEAFLTL